MPLCSRKLEATGETASTCCHVCRAVLLFVVRNFLSTELMIVFIDRIFLGKNTVAQVALGRTPETEFKDNLRHVSAVGFACVDCSCLYSLWPHSMRVLYLYSSWSETVVFSLLISPLLRSRSMAYSIECQRYLFSYCRCLLSQILQEICRSRLC